MAKCLLRIDDKNHPNSLRLLWQQITKYGRWQCRFIDGFLCVQFSLRMSTIWDFRCWRRRLKMIEINVCTSLMPPIQRKSCPDGWCRIWDIYLYKESVVSVCGRSPSYVISGMRFVRHWFKLASAIELLKWLNARIVWCAGEKNPVIIEPWWLVRVMAFIECPCWSEMEILYTRRSTLLIENCQLERTQLNPSTRCRSQLITFHFQKCAQTTLCCRFEHYFVNHIHLPHQRT